MVLCSSHGDVSTENLRKYRSELARKFADIESVLNDIEIAKEIFSDFYSQMRENHEDQAKRYSVWQLGVVYYARAFATGVRNSFKVAKIISSLFDDAQRFPLTPWLYLDAMGKRH